MTLKLILYGIRERFKVYAGIGLLYLLYAVVSYAYQPSPQMDGLLDWFFWSYDTGDVTVYVDIILLGSMAVAALLVAEIIIFVRDFYGSRAYMLFSLPVNGRQVIASRLGLFMLDFTMLAALDFPFRWPFYRTLVSNASGEIQRWSPWLTTSDVVTIGILVGVTWILVMAIVPLLTYLLIAAAKCLFDVSAGWLTAFVALGYGAFVGLGSIVAMDMPPLVSGSTTVAINLSVPIVLLVANILIFWAGTKVIDRKLSI